MNTTEIIHSISDAYHHTSGTEWIIFFCALLYIILVAIENSWGWLFGIIASALSVYLCYTAHLFLESGLNIFYVVIGIYGWYQWLYGSKYKTEIAITKLSGKKNLFLLLAGLATWLPFGYIAYTYSTQVLPFLDAFITAFSIIATWMTAKKIIENWLYWIVIDTLGIILFASRGYYLLALLNVIYTLMAAAGYFSWRKKITA
jgi:nicotinamide mononucleotide transporter